MKTILRILIVCLLANFATPTQAQFFIFGRKKAETAKADSTAKKEPPVTIGLFATQKVKNDWYFQIADSLLGKPFLAVTRFVSTPVELGTYGGELVSSEMYYWELAQGTDGKNDRKLVLRTLIYDASAPADDKIDMALRASTENPIIASFKIEKTIAPKDTTGGKRYSIKVTDFLREDNMLTGMTSATKAKLSISAARTELNYVVDVKTFPTNIEVSTVKTYSSKNSKAWSSKITGNMTFKLNTSFVRLPDKPMRRRFFDQRVGYFVEADRHYTDDQQQVRRRQYITRWRLEPKNEEDARRQAQGELIEPKKPIVYYIDPATPERWRPYLIEGVNDWNTAFEQAGWQNAIRAEEWPTDNPDMNLEDARYSVIRYLASPIKNAYGPHISDPRTGEILNTNIGWYHNVMELIHDWYMIQVGAVDTSARHMKLPDELMGQLIRFVSSHEVGHTLGLRHNMGASSATPTEKLRDKEWVEKNGHTVSIMDYARFNYVAQPEDGIGRDGLMPRINTYDKWAIEWGYKTFPDAKSDTEEKRLLNQMTVSRLADRRLWFGGEGHDNDPRALTEDLGDNPMLSAEYGIKNLKRILLQLPQWTREEADNYENLRQVYTSLIGQFRCYVGHAGRNIAGVYHEYKTVEQKGLVYWPEERARVSEALAFIDRHALKEPSWLITPDFVGMIESNPLRLIESIGEMAVSNLLAMSTLQNIVAYEGYEHTYNAEDYARDVIRMIFSEVYTSDKVSAYRRSIQRHAILVITGSWEKDTESSARPIYRFMMNELNKRLSTAKSSYAITDAHFADLRSMIEKCLKN